jgi:hypothetical protein
MAVNRPRRQRSIGRRALHLAGASVLLGSVVLAGASSVAGGAEAPGQPSSYEAVASAEGFRFSWGAPGFVAVDTFIDGGGPVSQSVIDGLGNSRAFASLPYPGDLAISGPGLLAGLTGLPSPPPYPFYVSSSHPTTPEAKVGQPGYELAATSAESTSKGSTMTGGGSGSEANASSIGKTVTGAETSRDAASGVVTAVATGTADVINIGGVLRIGQVDAKAKVTRGPGSEPTREASFAINGVTIAGQTVGFSEKGFTLGGTNTPIPPGNPLLEALKQAKITVAYLSRIDNQDGVVSPGLVIRHEQATPGGPTMVFRYVFGQMAASATVSGSPTSIGDSLPALDTGPSDTQVVGDTVPADTSTPTAIDTALPAGTDTGAYDSSSSSSNSTGSYDSGSGVATTTDPAPAEATPAPAAPPTNLVQEAAPISGTPMALVDTSSIYLILVAGATVALLGGTVLRLMGVKLKWTS